MSNIFPLFQEEPSNGGTDADRTGVIAIIASIAQLVRLVEQLSRNLDAVDQVVETMKDAGTRARLMHFSKTSRESLTHAVRELCQQLRKMPELQRQFVRELKMPN
jgi:hypothetical protein